MQEILEEMLGTETLEEQCSRCKCVKCGVKKSSWKELHPHHVTYEPSVVSYLCERCHARITYMNSRVSSQTKKKLSNKVRLKIWEKFLKEEIVEELYDKNLKWFTAFVEYVNG